MNKRQIITAAKKLNLHVTDNSNAANAAKDLFKANQRIVELEAIINITSDDLSHSELLVKNYYKKWSK